MFLAYFVAAAAVVYAFGESTPVWYSNAFVIVALLRQPVRTWPAYLLVAGIADAAAYALFGHRLAPVLALPDMLEVALVAGAIQLTGGVHAPIFEGGQIARVILACLLGPAVSGALGAWMVSSLLHVPFEEAWLTWYSAAALGLLIVGPFLFSWFDPLLRARAFERVSRHEAILLAGGAVLVALLLSVEHHQEILFFTFPVLFAMTWRLGLVGATVGVLVIALCSMYGTLEGRGALVSVALPFTAIGDRIQVMQAYLAAVLLSSLPLALLDARQRELAASLRRTGEARAEFLAAMSHEIRTPMTGVLGMVDLLSSEQLNPRQRSYVDAMRSSGRHLLSIINDILDFSRIESGKLELEVVDFSLRESIEHLRSLAHPLAVERGLPLHFELDAVQADALRGDPLRLRQVLLNLVGNAIKFTEQGKVTLTVSQRPREDAAGWCVRFAVQDTGVGIDPAQLQQLFAPFTQADRSIARQYGGSGLGLAISQRLVQAMGGELEATSVPGEGSTFCFELPLAPGDPRAAAVVESAQARPVAPRRILVAEDVEINRQILRTTLARQGHHVVFAHDGAQALELVQRQRFDIVLMDVQMPVLDGVEATRRIRQLPGPVSGIPIIGLTANVMARERERYLGAGMNACLAKPIEWRQLEAALADYGEGGLGASALDPWAEDAGMAASPLELVDDRALADLRELAGDEQVVELLRVGMRGYEDYCQRMEAPGVTAEAMLRDAHRLKGSSGTLGFGAISRLASIIEEAAAQGETPRELVPALRATMQATREELTRRGLLEEAA
ncbi:ATP-binding protein [Ramlibacter sp.]|uniref:ATP-binding protein n=1 Tax=Ramlibacter sp. TaxID=1917967 RepID=UPI002610B075|nr:ATP-binding protein [Ramlibacter sp.]MDB5956831.1 hybrid sensor histidine kinase/response regulator [Ramlibacter sp.]